MIAEDTAMVQTAGQPPEDDEDEADGIASRMLGSFFGRLKDTQMINAAEYKL